MENELNINLDGETKKIQIAPGLYLTQTVYQITMDGRSFVVFKNEDGKWQPDADHKVNPEWLEQIGEAIEAKP